MWFFFNDTATTEIYTLSLHDALPILSGSSQVVVSSWVSITGMRRWTGSTMRFGSVVRMTNAVVSSPRRSEEHTSELQSRQYLVCRLLLEKKKHPTTPFTILSPHALYT